MVKNDGIIKLRSNLNDSEPITTRQSVPIRRQPLLVNQIRLSPAIGIILMIIITVLLAGIIAWFAFNVAAPAMKPNVTNSISPVYNATAFKIIESNNEYYASHDVGYSIEVIHDDKYNVTCYVTMDQESISCIPDRELIPNV